jgi:predicted DNA binding protein
VLHPVVYFDRMETYRAVAGTKRDLGRLFRQIRRLGDIEMLSISDRAQLSTIRDLPVATVHFFEGLTDRQARCLVAAFEGGLLDVPARAGWDDVAGRERLSRSTFGEHLRKGQLRIMSNSYATLKARTLAKESPVLLHRYPKRSVRDKDPGILS